MTDANTASHPARPAERRPLAVLTLAVLATLDCILFSVLLARGSNACTPGNTNCDAMGSVYPALGAFTLVVLACVWTLYARSQVGWLLTAVFMGLITVYTLSYVFALVLDSEGYLLLKLPWQAMAVGVLNVGVLVLVLLPRTWCWIFGRKNYAEHPSHK